MNPLRQQFVEFAIETGVLRFGEFVTKAGRKSPYFSMRACSAVALRWAGWRDSMHRPC